METCIQEFKEEAKEMQRIETKLTMAETKSPQKKDGKYKSNSTKTFLERLERIKSADDKWQEGYSREKENVDHDKTESHKKRKRISISSSHFNLDEPPLKKRVTWAKTVMGGNTNDAEYRNVKRKNKREETLVENRHRNLT